MEKNSKLNAELSFDISGEFAEYLAVIGILDYSVVEDLSGEFVGVINGTGQCSGADLQAKIYVREV